MVKILSNIGIFQEIISPYKGLTVFKKNLHTGYTEKLAVAVYIFHKLANSKKNTAHRRQRISQPMWKEEPTLFCPSPRLKGLVEFFF